MTVPFLHTILLYFCSLPVLEQAGVFVPATIHPILLLSCVVQIQGGGHQHWYLHLPAFLVFERTVSIPEETALQIRWRLLYADGTLLLHIYHLFPSSGTAAFGDAAAKFCGISLAPSKTVEKVLLHATQQATDVVANGLLFVEAMSSSPLWYLLLLLFIIVVVQQQSSARIIIVVLLDIIMNDNK